MTIRNNYIKHTLTENKFYLSFEVVGPPQSVPFPKKNLKEHTPLSLVLYPKGKTFYNKIKTDLQLAEIDKHLQT